MSGDVTWSRFVWRHLDQAAAAELWAELADWVQWLRERYQLGSTIPKCWYRHGDVVEELTALMSAHTAAYQQMYGAKGIEIRDWDAMIAWHRGELAPARARVAAAMADCQGGECRRYEVKAPTDSEINEFIASDVERRTVSVAAPETDDTEFDALDDAETLDAETMAEHVDAGTATLDDDNRGAVFDNRHWTYDPDDQVFIAEE